MGGEKCRIQKDTMRGETRAVQNIPYVEVSVSKWIQGRRSFRPSGQKATGSLPNGIDLIYLLQRKNEERSGERGGDKNTETVVCFRKKKRFTWLTQLSEQNVSRASTLTAHFQMRRSVLQ